MNLASWILLVLILAICTYIIYSRTVNKSDNPCGDCTACAGKKDNKPSCCH